VGTVVLEAGDRPSHLPHLLVWGALLPAGERAPSDARILDSEPNDAGGLALPQHPDQHRPQVRVLLGVDQEVRGSRHEPGRVKVADGTSAVLTVGRLEHDEQGRAEGRRNRRDELAEATVGVGQVHGRTLAPPMRYSASELSPGRVVRDGAPGSGGMYGGCST
jgi:hypothetical protein